MQAKKVIRSDLGAAQALAEELLEEVRAEGYDHTELFAIHLALEEALINAIKHGNRFDAGKHVTVQVEADPQGTTITVADEGDGFDPGGLPDPTTDENLEKPCGRGLMLMRAFMDEVSYNDRGNQVRLMKRKSS